MTNKNKVNIIIWQPTLIKNSSTFVVIRNHSSTIIHDIFTLKYTTEKTINSKKYKIIQPHASLLVFIVELSFKACFKQEATTRWNGLLRGKKLGQKSYTQCFLILFYIWLLKQGMLIFLSQHLYISTFTWFSEYFLHLIPLVFTKCLL